MFGLHLGYLPTLGYRYSVWSYLYIWGTYRYTIWHSLHFGYNMYKIWRTFWVHLGAIFSLDLGLGYHQLLYIHVPLTCRLKCHTSFWNVRVHSYYICQASSSCRAQKSLALWKWSKYIHFSWLLCKANKHRRIKYKSFPRLTSRQTGPLYVIIFLALLVGYYWKVAQQNLWVRKEFIIIFGSMCSNRGLILLGFTYPQLQWRY